MVLKWKQNYSPQSVSKAEEVWAVLLDREIIPSIQAVTDRLRRLEDDGERELAPSNLHLARAIYPVFGEKMPELEVIFRCVRGSRLSGSLWKKLMQVT